MKKTFTLLTAVLLSFSLFAFTPQSMVSISSNSKYPISVSIDSRNCIEKKSNEISIKDIDPGYHTIKIYREKTGSSGNNRRNNNLELIYNGNICIKPGVHVDIMISRFGKAYIDERKISSAWYDDDDCYDWNHNTGYRQAMSVGEFSQLKQTICNSNFDNTKLVVAKQTISQNYFTAAQVKELVALFSFESSKLDIAKSAYRNSIDKNNYFIVSNEFAFSSSKEELARFIAISR